MTAFSPSKLRLGDVAVSGTAASFSEQAAFHELFGETTCTSSVIARSVEFFSLAFMATLIFIILQLPPVEAYFVTYIPDYEYRFVAKSLLFFVLIYIIDRIAIFIRDEINICRF
jgi:hypothetical protein